MRLAGMFAELSVLRPPTPQPSIHDHIAAGQLPDAEDVIRYLRAGHRLIAAMGGNDDVLDPAEYVMNGDSVLTDGTWLWRADLAHYLDRHHVELPAEFLELIRSRDYTVPAMDKADLAACAEYAGHLVFFGEDE